MSRRQANVQTWKGEEIGLGSAVSLLFSPGDRPGAKAIRMLAGGGKAEFSVSLEPQIADADDADVHRERWVELLVSGLTFDLTGLAGGEPAPMPARGHLYGVAPSVVDAPLEAITLVPGPHLAGGGSMLPVVRMLAWLGANLAKLPGTRAVVWHPARCWSGPQHFRDVVLRWIEGGVFPGFGLAAIMPMADGGLQTEGLALFTGQELRIEPDTAVDRAAAAKIALRLLHLLVESGPVDAAEQVTGPAGEKLRLEPSANGRFVRVWRD